MAVPNISYPFGRFDGIAAEILNNPSYSNLKALKNELNNFFKDCNCKEIIYTKNTDRLFFGMCVVPVLDDNEVARIVEDSKPMRIENYYIELDSKLLDDTLDITPGEFVAILLHEVGHLVKDSTPIEDVRKCIDVYLAKNNETISITDSANYREILRYGILNTLRKVTSIFERDDDEIIADEFVFACGYGNDLSTALKKISKNGFLINKNVKNKMIVLSWTLRLYKEVRFRRIPALRTLKNGMSMTGSKYEAREMQRVCDSLKKIDDSTLMEGRLIDGIKEKINATRKAVTYKGIRGFEDDLYEYSIRVKHLYDEDDALNTLRELNTKISILSDYVSNEEMSEQERLRWFGVLDKYYKIREELSKKKLYKFDYRAPIIQVNYPDIVPDRT
ncbi:MAG: hypothetical protein J6Y02_10740 [Pseudobutyrivibrio sp.]|nr:hypothetical protein [Pseudobutyrivibrio sp.]